MNGPEPGLEILPGLTLLRRLGSGGMGEAWLARDAMRGIDVVAKLLPGDAAPERLALLRREARLVRKLHHPRIVPVYGFHSGERFSAVTLRHMRGGDARALRGADPAAIVRLARDVAEALGYLHDLGVVHRDVKASNVLLDEAGRAHLADFGIASLAHADDEQGLVVRGGGSRASMSPQQRAGEPPLPADDLYALGVLLFELLSGQPPQLDASAGSPPSLPEPLRLPARLRGLVASLLAVSPAGRPASASAVRDELEAISAELSPAPETRDRQVVRLQPPPRAVDPDLATAGPEPSRELRLSGRHEDSAGHWRLALLGGLVALAIGVAAWLPRWAEAPPALAPTAPPAPAPSSPSPSARSEALRAEEAPPVAEARELPQPSSPPRVPAAASPPRATAVPLPSTPAPDPEPTPDLQAQALTLAGHRERGALLEAEEDWRGALSQYAAALAIDPHLTFALEGRERAEKRAALDEALERHLQRPDRLSAAAVAREADDLLERARGAEPTGPKLRARTAALEAALALARTPVAVVIESDGLTELALSRVGRLGTLTRRSLELAPGHYTLTGSRRGYRDVRRQFSLTPGGPAPVVSLRCEEAL